jgi:UDP-N-acetylmuramate dehydrogenase
VTTTFAELTTMRVGGPVGRLVVAEEAQHAVDAVREADTARESLLVIGGGSNIVVGDSGWPGAVVKMATSAIDVDGDRVTAQAGVEWDLLVRTCIAEGLAGVEALSGIPGTVGGTPIQNVGAYGSLTSEVLESVTVYDRHTGLLEQWGAERCGFGPHRQSVFKRNERWVVIDVTYRLRRSGQSKPIEYAELAERLGVEAGGTAAIADVREAVLAARRSRGMVLDPEDHDTWSVGSFFLNPVLQDVPEQAAGVRQFPDPEGVKVSAAWLIQNAGFPPGYGSDWGKGTVTLSGRHTLAVTNRGGATTADVMEFAAHIRKGVEARFGIRLSPECDLVNCSF